MKKSNPVELYFAWLLDLVCSSYEKSNYNSLLSLLFDIDFSWSMEFDDNRASDGLYLRYLYADETGNDEDQLSDLGNCSVLEMMIALARRCEDDILYDDINNWTRTIFWYMIENLGLKSENEKNFDSVWVETRIYKFLAREYEPSGYGGMFYVPSSSEDLREIDIWTQMNRWLNTMDFQ